MHFIRIMKRLNLLATVVKAAAKDSSNGVKHSFSIACIRERYNLILANKINKKSRVSKKILRNSFKLKP